MAGEELLHFYILTEERQPANTEKATGSQEHSCLMALHRSAQVPEQKEKQVLFTYSGATTKNNGLIV